MIMDVQEPGLLEAVYALRPELKDKSSFVMDAQGNITYWGDHDSDPPTNQEILQELQRQVDLWNKFKYYRDRKESLPNPYDLLWILYEDIKSGNVENGSFVSLLDEVLEKYPAPEN